MESKDYEYKYPEGNYDISEKRKEELINKIKNQVRKGFITNYQILNIGEYDNELDFIYDWLDINDISIKGINEKVNDEMLSYNELSKEKQIPTQKIIENQKTEELFLKLRSFSEKESPEYKAIRDKLIEDNMKLAKWVASCMQINLPKISLEDKKQMAYIGLIKAVDNFDPSLGYKFSTYATKAIYRIIVKEAYRESAEMKQNVIINEQLAILPKIKDKILIEKEREAMPEEIAEILDIPLKRVYILEEIIRLREKGSIEQIESEQKDIETVFSKISDGDKINSSDDIYIRDGVYIDEEDILPIGFKERNTIEDKIVIKSIKHDIEQSLKELKERDKEILIARFGLYDDKPKTLKELSKVYGVRNK